MKMPDPRQSVHYGQVQLSGEETAVALPLNTLSQATSYAIQLTCSHKAAPQLYHVVRPLQDLFYIRGGEVGVTVHFSIFVTTKSDHRIFSST